MTIVTEMVPSTQQPHWTAEMTSTLFVWRMGHQQPAAPRGTGSGTEDTVGQVEAGWELQEESSIEPNKCRAFGICWSL